MLFILLQRIFTFYPQRRGQEEIGIFYTFQAITKVTLWPYCRGSWISRQTLHQSAFAARASWES